MTDVDTDVDILPDALEDWLVLAKEHLLKVEQYLSLASVISRRAPCGQDIRLALHQVTVAADTINRFV